MSTNGKELLQVAALCDGTAIDHIPSDVVFKVVSLLNLQNEQHPITIGSNLESKKMGTKGIIKIKDKFFEDNEINKIAIIAPKAVLNIIRNYQVIEKKRPHLPDVIIDIVKCNNPKCITNNEPMKTRFEVVNHHELELNCHYCNLKINKDEIVLK